MSRRWFALGSVLAASALTLGLAGCGSDSSGAAATAATTADSGPEYEIVSDATVAAGLADTISKLTSMSTAPTTATTDAVAAVFNEWYSYEGTIREKDTTNYLTFEDALGAFKKAAAAGDQAGMTTALGDFSTTSSTYLAAHPG